MVRAVYYQRVYAGAVDAPEPFSDITREFVFIPSLRILLDVNREEVSSNPSYSLLIDQDDIADAYKAYKGMRGNGRVRFRNVRIFEYEKSDIQKLVRDLHALEDFQGRVTGELERLLNAANPPAS